MRYCYNTFGTCSVQIVFHIDDKTMPDGTTQKIVHSVEFLGGCSGNLQGICRLVEGMPVGHVIQRLEGIRCGAKPTSCPDQFATALRAALEQQQ